MSLRAAAPIVALLASITERPGIEIPPAPLLQAADAKRDRRAKRSTKPSVPRQLRSPRRVHAKKTGASQRAMVASLQRRINDRLRPEPVLQRKAFQL